MDEKAATMIRTTGGQYWLQTFEAGRMRSCECGDLGLESNVRTWCVGHGIRFHQEKPSVGHRSQGAAATVTR